MKHTPKSQNTHLLSNVMNQNPAFQAAQQGNVGFFQAADRNYILQLRETDFGWSVLFGTVYGGHLECSKVILQRWPELLHEPDNYGNTPFTWAIAWGQMEIFKFLIARNDKMIFRNTSSIGYSPLHYAISRPNLEMVRMLTEADPNFDSIPANQQGETPLMMAQILASGKTNDHVAVKIRDYLLGKTKGTNNAGAETTSGVNKSGGDENQPDPNKESTETEQNRGKTTSEGDKAEGDENQPDTDKESTGTKDDGEKATSDEKKDGVDQDQANMDPLERARVGDADFFKKVEPNVFLNSRNDYDESVLSLAVQYGHLECSKTVLEKCPELLYIQNINNDYTALHYAVLFRRNFDIVELLVNGAKKSLFRMAAKDGFLPIHAAVFSQVYDAVKILTEADSNFEFPPDNAGETPLMMATRIASTEPNDLVAAKIRDLLLPKQPRTEKESELSIPLEHLELYRRLVKRFGEITQPNLSTFMVGLIGKPLGNFLAVVAEMRITTPASVSQEKITEWEETYKFYTSMGLQIGWFQEWVSLYKGSLI